MSDKVIIEDVINQFNNSKQIWPTSDPWHFYTKNKIAAFIDQCHNVTSLCKNVINAGSAGENYGLDDTKTIHIDLIANRIKHKPNYVAANLEELPLPTDFSELIICVGSVINYCDAVRVITEFERISVKDSYLILEFECSNTLELLFSGQMNANATIRNTRYRDEPTKIWYYSKKWIEKILNSSGYQIIENHQWHYFSSLVLGVTKNLNFSNKFSIFDKVARVLPIVNKYYSNCIFLCKKIR